MRVPQVTDRVKEAPAQALRAVFSGVGSVLLVADRLRHRPGQETGQGNGHPARPATAPEGTSPAATASARNGGSPAAQGGPTAKAASPARAGSVKARSAAPPAPRTPPAPPTSANSPAPAKSGGRPAKATAPAPAKSGNGPTTATPAPASAKRGDGSAKATASAKGEAGTVTGAGGSATGALDGAVSESGAAGGLPLADYDGLTMPQLRARMRTLEPAQLRALIAHERAHAGRDEVVGMFERRIAKVEGGG
jgi:hypothetical protein